MKNKFISIMIIMFLIVCLVAQIVNAASLTVTMKPSSSSVKEATEFTVKVSVSNLDVGNNGINALSGYLKYDDDIFEDIDESNIEGLNKWSANFDESTGKIDLKKNTFVKTTQDVFQIVVKTKSGVSGKNGAISFSDITASNSEEDISASDISVSITVIENSGTSTSDDENSSTSNSSNATVSIIANSSSNESANDSSNSSIKNITSNSSNSSSNSNTDNNIISSSINNSSANNSSINNTSGNNGTSAIINTDSSNSSSNYTNTTSDDDMPKTGVSDTLVSLMLVMVVVALVFYIKIEKINKEL